MTNGLFPWRVCFRGRELPPPRCVSVHAGGPGHRPGAEEGPPRGPEGHGHGQLQGPLPGRAAALPGVHADRPALHHHGTQGGKPRRELGILPTVESSKTF